MHAIKKINAKQVELDEDAFEEMLNEVYGTVEICGYTYESGRALREIDPTAFRVGLADENGTSEQYECGKCGTVYESEDEAEACCNEEG